LAGKARLEIGEVEAEALAELVEVAVMLKKSGILGWLKALAENGDKLIELFTSDYPLFRQLGMLQAVGGGIARLEVGEYVDARMNAEKAFYCAFKGLSKADPAGAPRVGLLGMLRWLSDKDVQKGLGFLLMLAKGLGACMGELEKRERGK
jgi:uncharacterized protein YjgD (DUF1641 family)